MDRRFPRDERQPYLMEGCEVARSPFLRQATAITLLVYLDFFNILSSSSMSLDKFGKYPYFAWAVVAFAVLFLTSRCRESALTGQNVFFVLALVAFVPFTVQLVSGSEIGSFASAFAATLVFSASGVFDVSRYKPETASLLGGTLRLTMALCVLYVCELLLRRFSGWSYFDLNINETNHIKSICFVAGLSLAILASAWRTFVACAILTAISLVLRPSSSLVLGLATCLSLSCLVRFRWLRTAEYLCYLVLAAAASLPLILFCFPEIGTWLAGFESVVKEDVLSGTSNTSIRLAIQDMAFERLRSGSILFGEFFSGATTVEIGHIFPWWEDNNELGLAGIHSDFVTMLMEGGLVGYFAFVLGLLLGIKSGFARLQSSVAFGAVPPLQGLGIVMIIAVVVYASSNPFLQYFGVAHTAWYLVCLGAVSGRLEAYWQRSEISGDQSDCRDRPYGPESKPYFVSSGWRL